MTKHSIYNSSRVKAKKRNKKDKSNKIKNERNSSD